MLTSPLNDTACAWEHGQCDVTLTPAGFRVHCTSASCGNKILEEVADLVAFGPSVASNAAPFIAFISFVVTTLQA